MGCFSLISDLMETDLGLGVVGEFKNKLHPAQICLEIPIKKTDQIKLTCTNNLVINEQLFSVNIPFHWIIFFQFRFQKVHFIAFHLWVGLLDGTTFEMDLQDVLQLLLVFTIALLRNPSNTRIATFREQTLMWCFNIFPRSICLASMFILLFPKRLYIVPLM